MSFPRGRPSHPNRDDYDFARAQYFGFCVSTRAASSSAETEITLEHLSFSVKGTTESCYPKVARSRLWPSYETMQPIGPNISANIAHYWQNMGSYPRW